MLLGKLAKSEPAPPSFWFGSFRDFDPFSLRNDPGSHLLNSPFKETDSLLKARSELKSSKPTANESIYPMRSVRMRERERERERKRMRERVNRIKLTRDYERVVTAATRREKHPEERRLYEKDDRCQATDGNCRIAMGGGDCC